MAIILASQSPRRKEIMKLVGIEYTCIPSQVEEVCPADLPIEKKAEFLSALKANDIAKDHPDDIIIGSDTLVLIDGNTLGKPADEAEAADMLRKLSGRTHHVYTGVTIIFPEKDGERRSESFTSISEVEFYELSEEIIKWYIATGETLDKAGAYGIQGKGAVLIKGIRGDYFTVMGLPIAEVWRRIHPEIAMPKE